MPVSVSPVQTHGVAVRRLFGPLQGDRPWLGLILSASLLAVVGLTRYFVGRVSAGFEPIAFLPAILLAGLFGGIRIGLAIFAISMLGAWVWFFPPYGTFVLASRDAITFAVFVLTAALEVCVIRILNLAINDLTLERDRSNILFHELQHRVANNLQFAAAVLYTEKKTLSSDTAAAGALDAAESRLMLMSRVHRMLHDPASVNVPIERHLEDLCRDIIQASALPHIHLRVQAAPIRLPLASLMSLSLIVAELVTNSLKHAFGGRTNGAVTIVLETKKKTCILTVADDGGGVTIGAGDPKADGLGQGILRSLASQLLGTISFESNKGTTARVVFPFEK